MRHLANKVAGAAAAALLLGGLTLTSNVYAGVPSAEQCKDTAKLDKATQGGCVIIERRKGNCMACHLVEGIASGDIAPPLNAMKQRFPDKAVLRARVWDATAINPNTTMPPFGRHGILTEDEIDKVVEFLYTQ